MDEAELIEANPQYAHVRLSNGRESTVSLRDLAPYTPPIVNGSEPTNELPVEDSCEEVASEDIVCDPSPDVQSVPVPIPVRRSSRVSVPPVKLNL